MADLADWPLDDTDLEPPVIGLELAEDVHRHVCLGREDATCDEACLYFTGGHGSSGGWLLLGSASPGEIELELAVEPPNVAAMDWSVPDPHEIDPGNL